jgi:hypothetical protein
MRLIAFKNRSLYLLLALICGQLLAVALGRLIMIQPLIAVGLVYASGFWWLVWNRPHVALMLIFAIAPFQNDIGGGPVKFSFAEIHLGLTVPVLLVRNWITRRPIVLGPTAIPTALYFAVCLFSTFLNWRDTSLSSLLQQLLYMVMAVAVFSSLVPNEEDFKPALYGLVYVGVFMAVMGIITNYSFLGHNKNGIGASLACALLVCIELWFSLDIQKRKTWLSAAMVVIGAGLIMSLSRGSWLGTLAGFTFMIMMRRQYRLLFKAALIFIPLILVCWRVLPQSSREYVTGVSKDRWNIKLRYESLDIARGEYEKNPVYGVGVGLRKEYDATNLQWLVLAETGVLGLATFLFVHVAFLNMVWKTRRWYPPSDFRYSLLSIAGALILYKFVHGSVDHYWSRGAITPTWASVGMATFAYYAACHSKNSRSLQ